MIELLILFVLLERDRTMYSIRKEIIETFIQILNDIKDEVISN